MPLLRDWTDSDRVNALDAHAERFFTRLLMKVDDYGRTHAHERRLKSRLFPLMPDIRETDISRWMAACQKAGLLRFYVDGKGRTILEVFKFGQRKKFMRSEYDPPEDQAFLPLAGAKKNLHAVKEVEDEVEEKGKEPKALPQKNTSSEINGSHPQHHGHSAAQPKRKRELWQLLKDEAELKERLKSERDSSASDAELIAVFKGQLRAVRDEIKNLKPS